MDTFIGWQFGNYLLTRFLGRGGFAEVYLGEHRLLKTQAAIKIMFDSLNEQEFLEEARTIAAINHPNIVRVLEFDVKDLGQSKRASFLVMEYAVQGTLRQRHPKGTILPFVTALVYLQQVADALQYAHNQKIIHRDVKPENMLIDANGKILLSDFGIATVAHSTASLKTINTSGTPFYMAPEQWNGKPRPASDQYALGIVAYEWLSGQYPFQGNAHALPYQHQNVAPAPFAPALRVLPQVEMAIQRALAKDPDQRFPTIQSFVQALTPTHSSSKSNFQPQSRIVPPPPTLQQPDPPIVLRVTHHQNPPSPPLMTPPQPSAITDPDILSEPHTYYDPDMLYREGVKAQARGDLERTAALWQRVLAKQPGYGNGELMVQMEELMAQLLPTRIQQLRHQAEDARRQGSWHQEIVAWNNLLVLAPEDRQAQIRIPIARNNEQCAWMYESARKLSDENNLAATRQQLIALWQKAPYYGDPENLTRNSSLIVVPPGFEEQQKLNQQAAAREQAQQKRAAIREQKAQARKVFAKRVGFPIPVIGFFFFCTVGGIGTSVGGIGISVGAFRESLILVGIIIMVVVASLITLLGYRKAIHWPSLVILGIVSTACALIMDSWSFGRYPLNWIPATTSITFISGCLLDIIVSLFLKRKKKAAIGLSVFNAILLVLGFSVIITKSSDIPLISALSGIIGGASFGISCYICTRKGSISKANESASAGQE